MQNGCVAVIVGSAFAKAGAHDFVEIKTPYGPQMLQRRSAGARPAFVAFRHGLPHHYLPHQIPYRRLIWALHEVSCQALLLTSSVGVMDASLPLFSPLLLSDIIMLENALPDGTPATFFTEPQADQGHLVLDEGIFSPSLMQQVQQMAGSLGLGTLPEVTFAYAPGPRTKTRAENRAWRALGAQVNSMTLAPEAVLAAELGIACAAVGVGHKYALGQPMPPEGEGGIATSLVKSEESLSALLELFLENAQPTVANNTMYRFAAATARR